MRRELRDMNPRLVPPVVVPGFQVGFALTVIGVGDSALMPCEGLPDCTPAGRFPV